MFSFFLKKKKLRKNEKIIKLTIYHEEEEPMVTDEESFSSAKKKGITPFQNPGNQSMTPLNPFFQGFEPYWWRFPANFTRTFCAS